MLLVDRERTLVRLLHDNPFVSSNTNWNDDLEERKQQRGMDVIWMDVLLMPNILFLERHFERIHLGNRDIFLEPCMG